MNVHDLPRLRGLSELSPLPIWYLATPYSKYPHAVTDPDFRSPWPNVPDVVARRLEAAYREASRIGGVLLQRGIFTFSPIAHSHSYAMHRRIDPLDHAIWLPADAPLMEALPGLLIAEMDSWDRSYGIGKEVERFAAECKPVFRLPLDLQELR